MKKTTVLVTGGAGYIGSHTAKMLSDSGYDVVIIDNLSQGHTWALPENTTFYPIDLNNKKELSAVFRKHKVECVIHFAGSIEAGESMKSPAKFFNNNLTNTLNLLDAMLEADVKKIIFSSTAAVYGEPKYVPIDEDHPKAPTNYYGLSKLMIEQVLESYNHAYGLKFVALRYFNASGADESGRIGESHSPETHLIPLVLDVAKGKREEISVFGDDYDTKDGTCVRDYIHVNDLAQAHILAMEKIDTLKKEFINLGNGKGFSVMEIIDSCRNITGHSIPLRIAKRRSGDPATLIADYSKARRLLRWTPKRDISMIIQTSWNWHASSVLANVTVAEPKTPLAKT